MKNKALPSENRLILVVLSRLLPRSPARHQHQQVVTSVGALLGASVSARRQVEQAIQHCLSSGWISSSQVRGSKQPRYELTRDGAGKLRTGLGLRALPKPKNWLDVCAAVLVPLALKRPTGRAMGRKATLAADIMIAMHGLDRAGTLSEAIDQLCWRTLGSSETGPFTVAKVQRYLFRHLVTTPAKSQSDWQRSLVAQTVGATKSDDKSLQGAVVQRWLREHVDAPTNKAQSKRGTKRASRPKPASPVEHRAPADNDNVTHDMSQSQRRPSLAEFAAAVVQAAGGPNVRRFHDDRAFIGSIWEQMRDRQFIGNMSLDAFKAQLLEAHRAALLRLTRADLVAAMDPAEVARSEARYLGSTFHFVALDLAEAS